MEVGGGGSYIPQYLSIKQPYKTNRICVYTNVKFKNNKKGICSTLPVYHKYADIVIV